MRARTKTVAEHLLSGLGLPRLLRAARGGDVMILAYHNVVPDGETVAGDASLHLPQRAFARQLDLVRSAFDVVPLDALHRGDGARRTRPRAVITFDDAYVGALTAGVEELDARGLPATIFVCPGFVTRGSFWWDAVRAPGDRPFDAAFRDHAIHGLAGRDRDVRSYAEGAGLEVRDVAPSARPGDEEALHAAAAVEVITLGSHSWSHANLAALNPADLARELQESRSWLTARFDRVSDWISYPYGMDSPAVGRAAAAARYAGGLRIAGGWMGRDHEAWHHTPRVGVGSGLSHPGFELRTAGLFCS